VHARSIDDESTPSYFEYVPRRIDPGAPMLVSVHGISQNAREHAELFAPHAERHGVVVVAPVFDPQRFAGFQRLGAGKGRGRADRFLTHVVEDVRRRLGLTSARFAMFGFSGGGQFAHRYALLHPRRVRSLIVAAPGWYTFPDEELPYPLGVAHNRRYPHARCRLGAFLRIPVRILVGDRDTERDESFNTTPELDEQQGRNRVERAERWAEALRRAARARRQTPLVSHSTLPDTGHSFQESVVRGGLARIVFEALYF